MVVVHFVENFGTDKLLGEKLVEIVKENFGFIPTGIINTLGLRNPIYKRNVAYGHFCENTSDMPWKQLDKVEVLKAYL